jgi:hypothetical protein
MKKILFPLLGVTVLFFSFTTKTAATGKKDLPKNIASSFTAKYPDARIKKWEMKDNDYIVRFDENNEKCTSWYTPDGKWVKTERHFALSKDLPAAVREGFNHSPYMSWHIDNIKEVMNNDGQPLYVLHVDDGDKWDSDHYDAFKTDYLIYFSPDGTLKNKVKR